MRRFHGYLNGKGEIRKAHEIAFGELDTHIANFIISIKKEDGKNYEPDTLTSYHRSIDRYLRDVGYQYSILNSIEFTLSRRILQAKRKELKSLGFGNKPNKADPLSHADEERL